MSKKRNNSLKSLKISAVLIILGNMLYWILEYFASNDVSSFSEFTSGLLLGLSVGINVVGIILLVYYIVKKDQKKEK